MKSKNNYDSWYLLLIILFISISSPQDLRGQIKQNLPKYNFDYVTLSYGEQSSGYGTVPSTRIIGVEYRKKILGNFGVSGYLGYGFNSFQFYEIPYLRLPQYFSFDKGVAWGINISYLIPLVQNKFGIIPKLGFSNRAYQSVAYELIERGNYKDRPIEFNLNRTDYIHGNGRMGKYNEFRPVVGLDIHFKKFILGASTSLFFGTYEISCGYVLNNKLSK